ncbi:MAG: hypothetical protein LBH44_12540 [Treponema sp.]|nr:hypothetical protein [Treponema sp.]
MGSGLETADGNPRYGLGGGGDLGFEIDLSSIWSNPLGLGYTLGIEGGFLLNQVKGDEPKNMSFYSFGGSLGLYFFPLSRLFTRIDGAIGVYRPAYEGENGNAGLYFRGGGEIGFRFTPAFTLAASAGWRQFEADSKTFNSGLYAGLTAQLTFQTGKASGSESIAATLDQYDAVYPAFMQLYQRNAIGNLVIRNNENSEIRNVRVSFRASGYTASEFPCAELSIIQRGRNVELPLLADFSPAILRFTDKGRILGEVVIRYRFLGQERESVRTIIVAAHNRNTITTGDPAALAAFISPTSPEVLDYAKYISGLARTNRRIGHNANFQYAIWLLEGLRASGIRLGETYAAGNEEHKRSVVQFPAETLSIGTGSNRDLALLFATGLECVAIPAAFAQIDGTKGSDEFIAAVSLNINKGAAETLFIGTDKILVLNNEVWLPLSMNAFNEGFMTAWAKGVAAFNEAFKAGTTVDFVMVEEAWAVYPPAPLPGLGGRVIRTNTTAATEAVSRAMQAYITQEINPLIQRVGGGQGNLTLAARQNRLGILFARAGRMAEAKAAYERAAGMGLVPAMTNRGNLALAEKQFAIAERWFRQALQREPKNTAALRGLEQVEAYK